MPPDEIDATTFYNSGRIGASRVTYRIEDLADLIPRMTGTPYFEGNSPERFYNSFTEDDLMLFAQVLYIFPPMDWMSHLNHIFDYGRNYYAWRDLWDNHRGTMVSLRALIFNYMSTMTVYQANNIATSLNNLIQAMVDTEGTRLPPGGWNFVTRWTYSLARIYENGMVPFPENNFNTIETSIDSRLRSACPGLMRYIESSTEQYSNLTFETLDARLLYLGNACRTIALSARDSARSRVFSEEEKEYIRFLLEGMDISIDRLVNLMREETNLGNIAERRQLAENLYNGGLWAPFENAFLASIQPYDYEVNVDPVEGEDAVRVSITTPSGTPLEMSLTPPIDVDRMWTSSDIRDRLNNITRNLNISFPENLSDSEVEIFMRNYTAPSVISDEVITVPLPAGYADSVRRGDYEHSLGMTGTNTVAGFTGSYTAEGMTGGEVALNSQGVCNLNDLANAHSHNKNSSFVENIDKVPSEQEIWESLQRLHPGMMETIQYILDDCTIDYKESNKIKRIDKMKQEMVPRIKGVLTCMDDRLDHYDKHYLNKWLWELINFAIDCNGPLPYRRLAPNIKEWDQKEDSRMKKSHTSLHIIPRLPE